VIGETHVPAARERVDAEQVTVDAKVAAYETFVDRVRDVATDAGGGEAPGPVGTTLAATTRRSGGAAAVREAFEATVRSIEGVDDDASVFETLAAELGEEVAVALAPTTGATFTAQFRDQLIEAATERRWQLRTMATALEREAASLEAASEAFTAIREWLERADETPLRALGFDALQARHVRLDDHLDRCAERARDRQAFLDGSTSEHAKVGLGHRCLVAFLYEDLPVDYPVLDGVATLASTCERCQRNVRAHLTRCG
jgi:DNA-binding ferritin-like protein